MGISASDAIKKERISNAVSITVVIFSVFMSVCKVKDDNIVQAMQQAQVNAVDAWSEYGSKKLRMHLAEDTKRQVMLMRGTVVNGNTGNFDNEIDFQNQAIQKYQKDLETLQAKAKDYQASYDALNFHDDQFDMSDALLAIAMALTAVSSLVNRWLLFFIGFAAGCGGMVFGVAGFVGWNLHPTWLVAVLS